MHRYDLISCHDCGVLHRKRPAALRERARCVRCRSILYRGTSADKGRTGLNRIAAITLGALLTFLIAQFFPIVQLEVNGLSTSATLLGAIRVLWGEHMEVIAAMVFCFTILFPFVEMGALLYVTLGLRAGHRVPGFHRLLRSVQAARQWGMTEVLLIGILITVVKMTSMARVEPQPALFAFGALTVLLAIVVRFEPRMLWNLGDRLDEVARLGRHAANVQAVAEAKAETDGAGDSSASTDLLVCHACALVNRAAPAPASAHGATHAQHCARCGSTLHRRRPDSVNRTWALLVAAALLYIPANLLPVMYTRTLFGTEDDTILSGVVLFWTTGSHLLAIIIFIASIVVPVAKLVALVILAATAQRRSRWRPLQRTKLYRLVEFVGRWSMLDIFVVTLTVALVRFQSLAVITAGPGALAFGAVVVLTMLASMQFDPRLIWDPIEPHGELHA